METFSSSSNRQGPEGNFAREQPGGGRCRSIPVFRALRFQPQELRASLWQSGSQVFS